MRPLAALLLVIGPASLTSCGSPDNSPDTAPPYSHQLPADLADKQSTYVALAPFVQDANGFIETDKCDSLLMTALLGTPQDAGAVQIGNLQAAEVEPGKWLRKPPSAGSCYPVGSGSEISRDMLVGVMFYAWAHRDLDMLQRLYSYGETHSWVMGAGDVTRTGLRTLRGTLAAAIHALGGPYRLDDELITDPQLIVKDGYEAHLQVLVLLLRGEIYGDLSAYSRQILRRLADGNPDSPIMQAAAARWVGQEYAPRFVAAARAEYWPAGRLPTSDDRCGEWLTQADDKDWQPCPSEGKIHSGGDILFAMHVYTLE